MFHPSQTLTSKPFYIQFLHLDRLDPLQVRNLSMFQFHPFQILHHLDKRSCRRIAMGHVPIRRKPEI
jgi:hypothetical protein